MGYPVRENLTIKKGSTFTRVVRWSAPPFIYKEITAITKAAPAVLTAPLHGLVAGWRFAISDVAGMIQINAKTTPPSILDDYHKATVLTPNTIEINDLSSASYSAYTSGGYIRYLTPVDLTGYTARMQIRARFTASIILDTLSTANSRITLDNVAKTITLLFPEANTTAYTFKTGVYDLELISSGGLVTPFLTGGISIVEEATR